MSAPATGEAGPDAAREPTSKDATRDHLIGRASILASCLFFYLSTVPVAQTDPALGLNAWDFCFYRMLVGLIAVAAVISLRGSWRRPQHYGLLVARGVSNMAALLVLYHAAELSTAMEANIINSAYPVFIVMIYFVFRPETRDYAGYLLSLIAVAGIYLVMGHDLNLQGGSGEAWGLLSAMLSSIAIIVLNLARRGNDTNLVLFYMFLTGTVLMILIGPGKLFIPSLQQLQPLVLSGLLGVGAQYLLTNGARFVTPVENGILSSARILFAVLVGQFIIGEKILTVSEWCGALMIFLSNVYMVRRRVRPD